ncbi:MAG: RrF2 family transcriptional regulator [Coriobacteriaceae bacterium]|nr:RrF2 family transcriptional regulator [Coriobacteriaceae bacterium]
MLVSTKGRYALRVMVDLAQHTDEDRIPLKEIAERQEISEKYLESIIRLLVRDGFVVGARGKGGGYTLTRAPQDYDVYSILVAADESLAPVSCLEDEPVICPRAADCPTLPLWRNLDQLIEDYLQGVSLADLVDNTAGGDDYVI